MTWVLSIKLMLAFFAGASVASMLFWRPLSNYDELVDSLEETIQDLRDAVHFQSQTIKALKESQNGQS